MQKFSDRTAFREWLMTSFARFSNEAVVASAFRQLEHEGHLRFVRQENGDYSIEMTAEDDYIDSMPFLKKVYERAAGLDSPPLAEDIVDRIQGWLVRPLCVGKNIADGCSLMRYSDRRQFARRILDRAIEERVLQQNKNGSFSLLGIYPSQIGDIAHILILEGQRYKESGKQEGIILPEVGPRVA